MARDSIARDLARLGVKRMLLAIHDVSFPSDPDESGAYRATLGSWAG